MPARKAGDFYPAIRPYDSGHLRVSPVHEIYYEQSGNPNGKPVVFLHGGPGGGTDSKMRRFFDPKRYRIVLFDQRGCGKSRPPASLEDNTTWHLVADIEALREHLKIGKWQVFGGSWGSTLALAYSQKHPERCTELVLRGIFLLRRWELEWFYQDPGGAAALFPDLWEHYVEPLSDEERKDCMRAYYRRLTSDDRKTLLAAARSWSIWEGALSYIKMNQDNVKKYGDPEFAAAFARIECHYFVNGGWLEREKPVARRRAQDPPHPRDHRAGALRRRVPDAYRLGPAQGLAGSRSPRRSRRRALGLRAGHRARADQGHGPLLATMNVAPGFCKNGLKSKGDAPIQLLPGPAPAQRRVRAGTMGAEVFRNDSNLILATPPPSPALGEIRPSRCIDEPFPDQPGARIGRILLEPRACRSEAERITPGIHVGQHALTAHG